MKSNLNNSFKIILKVASLSKVQIQTVMGYKSWDSVQIYTVK